MATETELQEAIRELNQLVLDMELETFGEAADPEFWWEPEDVATIKRAWLLIQDQLALRGDA